MSVDAGFMEALYSVRVVGRYAIARHISSYLGVSERFILKKLRSVEKIGDLGFSMEYPLRAFRLKRAAVFTKDEGAAAELLRRFRVEGYYVFARSVISLIPVGTAIVLHLPAEVDVRKLPIPDKAFTIEYDETLRNMVDLRAYGERVMFKEDAALSQNNLQILSKQLEHADELDPDVPEYVNSLLNINHRFDWADLAILKELEKNPLASIEQLAKVANLSIHRLRKHIYRHVQPIIRGIRVRKTPVTKRLRTFILVIGRGRNIIDVYRFSRIIIRHPLVAGVAINLGNGDFIIQVFVSSSIARDITDYFRALIYELDFEFIDAFMGIPSKTFTLPYAKFREYVPKIKWVWRVGKNSVKASDGRSDYG